MKKISLTSFITAIVLIVCAIVLNVYGFYYINGVRVLRQTGYGFMHMTYYTDTSMTNTCFGMIIAGGFLFIGGILLLMLATLTRCRGKKCCHEHKAEVALLPEAEVKAEEPKAEPEVTKEETCSCNEQANVEEQN